MCITVLFGGIIHTIAESSRFSGVEIFHLRPLSPSFVIEPCEKCTVIDTPLQQVGRPGAVHELYRQNPPTDRQNSTWPSTISTLARIVSVSRRLWAVQQSQHGMVVILRPSDIVDAGRFSNKKLLSGVGRGFFQAVLLIFLTVLFGSTYRSNILLASIFLISFITITVLSRTYSIYFCAWMELAVDTIQITYDTPAELNAIRNVLSGMPSVLVHNTTRGRKYAGGNRLHRKYDCTNDTSPITKPLSSRIGRTTAMYSVISIVGMTLAIYFTWIIPFPGDNYFYGYTGIGFLGALLFCIVGFVVEKLYSDFEFIETHGDIVTDSAEAISPV